MGGALLMSLLNGSQKNFMRNSFMCHVIFKQIS